MNAEKVMRFLQEEIHTTVVATVDDSGMPVTCTIDMMDWDENGLYFLTAKGKKFYERLTQRGVLALTGNKGPDTMHCVSVSLRGRVREIGPMRLPALFAKNPYMQEIYPTKSGQSALTVFQIYEASGEWFDLSKKPIERYSFAIGQGKRETHGYIVTGRCIGCKVCRAVCPQNCILFKNEKAVICQENCLHCGNCFRDCPVQAVEKR